MGKKRKRYKNTKINNFFKIFAILFVSATLINVYINSKVVIDIEVQNAKVNEMMIVNIDVKKGSEYINANSLDLELRHKYKNDEKITSTIQPYAVGRYQIYYYPQVQGEYYIDVTAKTEKETIYKNDTIKVE